MNKKNVAEQATGIKQTGNIQFWSDDMKIKEKQAKEFLYQNKEVAVPNAGAGSYDEAFENLGFDKIEIVESTSSAGDWTFGIKDKTGWRLAWQENRYPYYGFRYSIDLDNSGFETFDNLLKFLEATL